MKKTSKDLLEIRWGEGGGRLWNRWVRNQFSNLPAVWDLLLRNQRCGTKSRKRTFELALRLKEWMHWNALGKPQWSCESDSIIWNRFSSGCAKSSDLWWGGWIGVHTAIWCPATCRRHIVAFLSLYLKSKTRKREIRHSDRQEGTKITRDQIFRNCVWVVLPWPEGLLMARVILHSLSSYGKSLNTFIHSRVCIVKHCSLGSDWPLICIKEIQIIT